MESSSTTLQEHANFLEHFLDIYFGSILYPARPEIVVMNFFFIRYLTSYTMYWAFFFY